MVGQIYFVILETPILSLNSCSKHGIYLGVAICRTLVWRYPTEPIDSWARPLNGHECAVGVNHQVAIQPIRHLNVLLVMPFVHQMRPVLVEIYLLFWSLLELGVWVTAQRKFIGNSSLCEFLLELWAITCLESTKVNGRVKIWFQLYFLFVKIRLGALWGYLLILT